MNRLNYAIQGQAMKRLTTIFLMLMLGGCQTIGMHDDLAPNLPSIDSSLRDAQASESIPTPPPEVTAALLPPVQLALPEAVRPTEPRFDVAVNHVGAQQFFMGLVDGTRYNMVVHPEVGGDISLTLKNVTVNEVMQTINSVYGYEYRQNGSVYEVLPARLRSKVFKVDYLNMRRIGTSQTRVSSGQISQSSSGGSGNGDSGSNSTNTESGTSGSSSSSNEVVSGTEVNTRSDSDFWLDLKSTLELLIGTEGGNRVVVNPQAGLVVIRAMPGDIREAEEYLSTLQNAVQRQVILEAKIIEVELNDGFQSGINWAALGEPGEGKSILVGQFGGGSLVNGGQGGSVNSPVSNGLSSGFEFNTFGGMFGVAADLNDFAALIELLKTQGKVQVLSSPRVSTVNNQKAVIKVGTDEYFVTDLNTDTNTSSNSSTTTQTVDVQLTPFFSGVALDVIPQINDNDEVILHIHPTISEVTEQNKEIAITTENSLSVPLARSTIRESDTIVRARSGQVVVIGGLMKDARRDDLAKTPFLGDLPGIGAAFQHRRQRATKSELVILLRPHVITGQRGWTDQLQGATQRFDSLQGTSDAR